VFVIAAPIGAIAFLAAWFIPQVELRRGVGTAPEPPSDTSLASDLPEREPSDADQHAPATAKLLGEI
jgi:hypothetical protein